MEINVNLFSLLEGYIDPDCFLSTLERYNKYLEKEIKPLAKKKLRDQDIGKRRLFVIYLMKFRELYERKTQEEADYQRKIEETKKRSCIPNTGSVNRFKKLCS